MQGDLLNGYPEEEWKVLDIKKEKHGEEELVIYAHTRPLNWTEPPPSDKLPWEE